MFPPLGSNPSSSAQGTTPGSFANPPRVGPGVTGATTFSSPDTPGMPPPSHRTAWDFLPAGWATAEVPGAAADTFARKPFDPARGEVVFRQGDGTFRRVGFPAGFAPITQLEFARLGIITPEMRRVAEREPHLTAGAGPRRGRRRADGHPRQQVHLGYKLDPMAHRPGGEDEDQRQHGRVAGLVRHRRRSREAAVGRAVGGRHGDGPVHRRRPRRLPRRDHPEQHRPDRHRPDLLDDHRPQDRRPRRPTIDPRVARAPGAGRASTTSRSTPACSASTCRSSATG